jgi:hypothetical protein
MSNLNSARLEMALVSIQDRCMVCAKRTISSVIVLDAPNGTPWYEAQMEACFSLFGDSATLDAR